MFSCYLSHDLDNILLENLGDTRTLQAVFELEALVLTGMTITPVNFTINSGIILATSTSSFHLLLHTIVGVT